MEKNYNVKYGDNNNFFVTEQVEDNSVVLDIGCWNGNNWNYLINNKKCLVDGIDFDNESLKIAKNNWYKDIFCLNLNENYNIDFLEDNKYDFIILADILEHLIYPESLLLLLKNKLKVGGSIIISVPNIAFVLYRYKLLVWIFEYSRKGGVMDINHLRFFTKNTIQKLSVDAGYSIELFKGYNIVKDRFFFLRFLWRIFPSLFALQFLVKLKK